MEIRIRMSVQTILQAEWQSSIIQGNSIWSAACAGNVCIQSCTSTDRV